MTTVAILGRPNVGKSTLFNRLTAGAGSPAITHATAGTTRDARLCPAELFGLTFTLVDTAGVEEGKGQTELQGQLNTLALAAVAKADVLILLLDAASGLMPADRALAQHARKLNRPVIVVLNKADLKTALAHSVEVESLGFGQPIMLSAAHNQGFEDLHTALALHVTAGQQPSGSAQPTVAAPRPPRLSRSAHKAALAATAGSQPSTATPASAGTEFRIPNSEFRPTRLAILGRPNVGKSTLINTLMRSEVMLTGPLAGLTREAIAHPFLYKDNSFILIDTPGLRRKNRVDEGGLEFLSVGQSLQAVEKADIIVLLLDASGHNTGKGTWQVFEQQDAQIAQMIINQYKPLIIGLTKWDLVEEPEVCLADVRHQLGTRLHAIHTPLLVPISSIKGKGIKSLLEAVLKVKKLQFATFGTNKLNNLLNRVLAKRSPPLANGKVVSLKFIRQTGTNPPSFTFWGNRIDAVSNHYKQFLRNQLAEALSLEAIPLRIYFRANANPFHGSKKPGPGARQGARKGARKK